MNQYLKTIQDLLQQKNQLSEQEKDALIKAIVDADKQWSITDFKLDRTEKVKKTTAILLEETIAELEQKRKAVEAQNRELEIESALERVRSVAMGMKKPEDMLDVCKTISQQLELLHIKEIRNIQTAIFYEATSIYINYEFYRKHDKLLITEVDYDNHPVAQDFADRMTKGPNHVWTHEFKGEEVRDWLTFQKTTNVFIDSYLEKANSLNYYWFSLGPVALGISTYSPLNEEEINLFKRFRNVFELAYRRYIDIEKAEAQAREAQIEAALERVRSRSMGMQKSDELREVVAVLYEQMEPLGLAKYGCELILCNEQTDQLEFWHANPIQSVMPECYYVSRSVDPICEQQWKAWKEGTSGLIIELKGEKKHAFDNVLLTKTDFKKLPDNIKKWINAEDIIVLSCATMKFGFLEAIDIEALQEAKLLVLNRFAKVFEQTYTRFLDLQKAEAQAREAQIQLAMERVRARTMAMQKSEELKDAAALLFQQAKSLGVPAYSCGYNIWEKNEKEFTSWMSTQDGSDFNAVSNIPLTEDANFIRFADSRQKGEPFFVLELRGERMKEHYEYLKTIPAFKAYFDYAVSMGFDLPETQIHHLANFSQGNLLFITLEPCPEFHDVFKRFASVFEQTYTRFLDLQKAEAQARESQIQLALERVRARTMAMQKSEELSETSFVLFQQLKELGEDSDQITIGIFEEDHPVITLYATTHGSQWTHGAKIELNKHSVYPRIYSAWKNNLKLFVIDISGKELEALNKFKLESPDYQIWSADELPKDRWLFYCAYFSNGFVSLGTSIPRSNESIHLLERFAQVFEQTYTRFLDLQKAEAQAREAKIEAALEKVRSRTMAMQRSEELSNVATVLFQQVKSLGVPQWTCGFCIWDIGDTESMWYPGSPDGEIIAPMRFPLTEHPVFRIMDESRKRGDELYIYEKEGEVQADHYRYMMTLPGVREILQGMLDAGLTIPTFQIDHYANFAYGNLIFITYEHFPEMHDIFKRFAKVFEQTYTRFLDLQKAEAQAREAQIELALERVRASSMAMQDSGDIHQVINVVTEQLQSLGIHFDTANFITNYTDNGWDMWVSTPGVPVPDKIYVPYLDIKVFNQVINAKMQNNDFFSYTLTHEEKNEFFKYLFENTLMRYTPEERKQYVYHANGLAASVVILNNVFFTVANYQSTPYTEQENGVIKRIGNVFDQSYTRFLDLQKAEAQAREAQIEAALERVRARTMAMHSSEDVSAATTVLFNELFKLGIETLRCGILIIDENQTMEVWTTSSGASGQIRKITGRLDMKIHPLLQGVYRSWKQNDEFYKYELRGQDKLEYYKFLSNSPGYSGVTIDPNSPDHFSEVFFFKEGGLFTFSVLAHSEEIKLVLKKFTAVFSLTFRRYQDLKKAEAQAREAHIEASLERVRARTMAMHSSEDVSSATATMFNELEKLNIQNLRAGILNIRTDQTMEVWSVNTLEDGSIIRAIGDFDMKMHTLWHQLYKQWINKEEFFHFDMSGKDKEDYIRILDARRDYLPNGLQHLPDCSVQSYFFGEGAVWTYSLQPHTEEDKQVMKRFASVFSLTFRRYMDLQKAEAQAREAQIEAALERVRARAMAMHKSDDLKTAVATVFEEMDKLNLGLIRCGIAILDKEKPRGDIWTTIKSEQGNTLQVSGDEPLNIHPLLQGAYDAWLRHEDYSYVLENDDLLNYYQVITQTNFQRAIAATFDTSKKERQHYFNAVFQDGSLFAFLDTAFTDEAITVMKRFANVFNLTYKRFLDLQKAEAQAREAQIEASLERVRAHAMAMHNSNDLSSTVNIFFKELKALGITPMRCGVGEMQEETHTSDLVFTTADKQGELYELPGKLKHEGHPVVENMYNYWKRQEEYHPVLQGADINAYYRIIKSQMTLPDFPEYAKHYGNYFYFKEGFFFAWADEELSEEGLNICRRFTSVLSLTYKRYKDLKTAEANAREATIEAALEKVRGKAMAMHNSNDLSVTASMVFTELRKLGINPVRCGVSLQAKDTRKNLLYYSIPSPAGDTLSLAGSALLSGHPVLSEIYDSWLRGEDYFPVLKGESLTNYYQTLKQVGFDVPVSPSGHEQYGYYLAFSEGMFYVWVEKSFTESEIKILKRFASVIDLTFRRYFELQKSEANAREAVKQAALDRVRAEIASMRTISDLDRITPLIWNELNILGIPFIRCGVFIMDESQQLIHTFLSTPDGKAIAAFHLPYDTPGHFPDLIDHWHNKKIYVRRWSQDDFLGIANTLVRQGAIATKEQYLGTLPKGGFYLHFLPFLQGLLYVGNTDQLGEEDIILIQHVADAFSTAYARYEDFNKLEVAKQQVDKTLVDLKQAQTQLVQSEKMASLGELTAGIAHEIQNPLNFVNNFSDVSNELLEEMKGELATGNMQQAIAIADDVRQNLEKILHHGKRADAIVKGMLQHSRASSGQKEPTDINALADEYLRLAYHGLRAKEKSFNAKFETDFDQSIGKINIIPQEIGRVVLNLINNAFYACTELSRSTASLPSPKNIGTGAGGISEPVSNKIPTVWISTKKESNKVLISVRDNGPGIPANILDKIFQPFFTTKPTGQGTGLGLSLSYDILKAHGGEIRVETKVGEGTDFIINLPYRYQ